MGENVPDKNLILSGKYSIQTVKNRRTKLIVLQISKEFYAVFLSDLM